MVRCEWCLSDALYMKYHDEEWGTPVHDDRKHFDLYIWRFADGKPVVHAMLFRSWTTTPTWRMLNEKISPSSAMPEQLMKRGT